MTADALPSTDPSALTTQEFLMEAAYALDEENAQDRAIYYAEAAGDIQTVMRLGQDGVERGDARLAAYDAYLTTVSECMWPHIEAGREFWAEKREWHQGKAEGQIDEMYKEPGYLTLLLGLSRVGGIPAWLGEAGEALVACGEADGAAAPAAVGPSQADAPDPPPPMPTASALPSVASRRPLVLGFLDHVADAIAEQADLVYAQAVASSEFDLAAWGRANSELAQATTAESEWLRANPPTPCYADLYGRWRAINEDMGRAARMGARAANEMNARLMAESTAAMEAVVENMDRFATTVESRTQSLASECRTETVAIEIEPSVTPRPASRPAPTPTPRLATAKEVAVNDLLGSVALKGCRTFDEKGRHDPFEFGAVAAIRCDKFGGHVDQLALFRFPDAASMATYWRWRLSRISPTTATRVAACKDGKRGRDAWAHGDYVCWVDSVTKGSKLRWTDERTDTYGVIDADNDDLAKLHARWVALRP